MDKKTIGAFIAALRKANGMTQRDLAERLNVSDKTVSRWERDEGNPDLSMIPVIAEIFDVTCDELLRGQRKSPEDRIEAPSSVEYTAKGEKERQRILKSSWSQYQNQTYIATGITVTGLIVALICNLAFLRASLGCLSGVGVMVVGLIYLSIAMNKAFLSVEDSGIDEAELAKYKRKVLDFAFVTRARTAACLGFILPLAPMDAFVGLGPDNLLLFGIPGACAALLAYAIYWFFMKAYLVKKGVYVLAEREVEVYHHNRKLKKKCAVVLAVALIVTFVGHQAATTIWGPFTIMDGTTFHDYESFVQYMEQDVPSEMDAYWGEVSSVPDHDVTNYDEFGNEITWEEAHRQTLEDPDGNVLCEYIKRNQSVISIQYSFSKKDGDALPITVYTYEDRNEAKDKAAVRHVIFGFVYVIEVAAMLVVYYKRRLSCSARP
ncbi:MAG: helix-turn-helix transcriptional regulator [Clostridiales bacterium]|nr:helix-turn-helix transcriptional regulator [Clostridiales bacterium]